jgi:hypothetical protein
MTDLEIYTQWDSVPAHLKTKSQLRNEALRLASGQQPAAQFQSTRKGEPVQYDLYDVSRCIPVDTLEPGYIIAEVGHWEAGRRRAFITGKATLVGTKFDEIIGGSNEVSHSVVGLAYVHPGQILTYWSAVHWNRGVNKASFWIVQIDWTRPEPLKLSHPEVGFYFTGHFNILAAGATKTTAIRLLKWWKEFRPDVERTASLAKYLGEQVGIRGKQEPDQILTNEVGGKLYYKAGSGAWPSRPWPAG